MSTGAPPSSGLPHRTVAAIRTTGSASALGSGSGVGSSSPHTPRTGGIGGGTGSAYGSPASGASSLRADDDVVVVEVGARHLLVGLAGDASARSGRVEFGPETVRRAGDYRKWILPRPGAPGMSSSRKGPSLETFAEEDEEADTAGSAAPDEDVSILNAWSNEYELWGLDLRGLDQGLLGDRIERALRDAFTKHLLVDSRPRRVALVLPSAMSIPLVSSILDTLFVRFQSPFVSLLSSSVMNTVSAGVRSALVVDIGWAETTVTSVYEYREVKTDRSVRAGKMLLRRVKKLLEDVSRHQLATQEEEGWAHTQTPHFSFEECEEVATRLLYCKQTPKTGEVGETSQTTSQEGIDQKGLEIPGPASIPGFNITIPFSRVSEPCESTFFEPSWSFRSFDDHELPLHLLVYRALLYLPLDIRAVCMSRIIFTGGCSKILGLRGRVMDEVATLAAERKWEPVVGKGVEQLRSNPKLNRNGVDGPEKGRENRSAYEHARTGAAFAEPEIDDIDKHLLKKGGADTSSLTGTLRCIDSLGAWSGASLMTLLKISAIASLDRELWLQQGLAGASRPADADSKVQQRQSMGPGGLMRAAAVGNQANWTLGIWGSLS